MHANQYSEVEFNAAVHAVCALALSVATMGVLAQQDPQAEKLPAVTVSAKANPNPVEKSYRRMLAGLDLFDHQHAMSPNAALRFKLLPRKKGTDMRTVTLAVVGDSVDIVVPIAADNTFVLPRNAQAKNEDAQVVPNRRALSLTWRTDIRTPGLPTNTRRLGDLRLECKVGMEAGLISNSGNLMGRLFSAVFDTPAYCDKPEPLYLFFADRPLFSVALQNGDRRQVLSIDKLYANSSDDTGMRDNLPFCDCEVLVDRTYVLPLGDRTWPDDTLVLFDYMDSE
ncbi:MAG: hypothetical protein ABIZ09_17005 [Rhodoferax sp.]